MSSAGLPRRGRGGTRGHNRLRSEVVNGARFRKNGRSQDLLGGFFRLKKRNLLRKTVLETCWLTLTPAGLPQRGRGGMRGHKRLRSSMVLAFVEMGGQGLLGGFFRLKKRNLHQKMVLETCWPSAVGLPHSATRRHAWDHEP